MSSELTSSIPSATPGAITNFQIDRWAFVYLSRVPKGGRIRSTGSRKLTSTKCKVCSFPRSLRGIFHASKILARGSWKNVIFAPSYPDAPLSIFFLILPCPEGSPATVLKTSRCNTERIVPGDGKIGVPSTDQAIFFHAILKLRMVHSNPTRSYFSFAFISTNRNAF